MTLLSQFGLFKKPLQFATILWPTLVPLERGLRLPETIFQVEVLVLQNKIGIVVCIPWTYNSRETIMMKTW